MAYKYNHKAFIVSLLRRGTFKFPFRNEAMKLARVEYGRYLCNMCKQVVWRRDVKVDHITPAVGIEGFVDWNTYIDRMYPQDVNAFQVLCNDCHKIKTKQEVDARKLYRHSKKKKKLTKKRK